VVDRCLLADEAVVERNKSVFSALCAPERRIDQSLRHLAARSDASHAGLAGSLPIPLADRFGSA
jgi:hypothetical protein